MQFVNWNDHVRAHRIYAPSLKFTEMRSQGFSQDITSGCSQCPVPRSRSIASPLKLVEYAAAGLHVVGIDHEGHRWEGQEDWLHLIEGGRGWIERAARTIMMLHRGGLERSKQAQAAATTRTWAASAQRMLDAMA